MSIFVRIFSALGTLVYSQDLIQKKIAPISNDARALSNEVSADEIIVRRMLKGSAFSCFGFGSWF